MRVAEDDRIDAGDLRGYGVHHVLGHLRHRSLRRFRSKPGVRGNNYDVRMFARFHPGDGLFSCSARHPRTDSLCSAQAGPIGGCRVW